MLPVNDRESRWDVRNSCFGNMIAEFRLGWVVVEAAVMGGKEHISRGVLKKYECLDKQDKAN